MSQQGITPRDKDFSQWFIDICTKAELADYTPVRGCMVIRPNGYGIWENIQHRLDKLIKQTGHRNVYFPLFVPKSFLSKEAEHVEGFAKECAVVTHYRLKNDPNGGGVIVDPEAKLEEELIVRPTSETIIWSMYKKWIQSYRDLPLLLNQWANVVRWEMRTRLFMRTSEFLWQEGHTAHATDEEAEIETIKMLNVYRQVMEDYLAIPTVVGRKTEAEKFAGAKHTYTLEGLMQDGKALQMATSHHLGQNFAKAFDVQFQTEQGTREYVHATSWGFSTRVIGALIMTHSDDNGLVLPPRVAPTPIVVVPIFKTPEELSTILAALEPVLAPLKERYEGLIIDTRPHLTPGFKYAEWELKGVPVRLEIGPRDLTESQVTAVRRDKRRGEAGQKITVPFANLANALPNLLDEIQSDLFKKAKSRLEANIHRVENLQDMQSRIEKELGFYDVFFDGNSEDEENIKQATGATARCIPLDKLEGEEGVCFFTGRKTRRRVFFARAY